MVVTLVPGLLTQTNWKVGKVRFFQEEVVNYQNNSKKSDFIIEEMFFVLIAGSTPGLVARLELNIQGAPGRS